MGYSIVHVDEVEPAGPGGAVRFVRRKLGVEAFGINWFELSPNAVGREHDEADSGQEEVAVVLRGSGVYRIDGEEIPVRAGRSSDSTRRRPAARRRAGRDDAACGRRTAGSYEARGPF